jgi:Ribbon-helix-helix protein, copG family
MGKNTGSAVISVRLPLETAAALKRMAKDRDTNINAMVLRMLTRRVTEIRKEEGW